MQLPINIGLSSSNIFYSADLSKLPHLFISYTNAGQFSLMVSEIAKQLVSVDPSTIFAVAASTALNAALTAYLPVSSLLRIYPGVDTEGDSPRKFLNAIFKEVRKRNSWMETGRKAAPALVIYIEHLVDLIIIRQRRDLAVKFIRLLLDGPALGIHCILGSPASFQNVIRQLMQVHPTVRELLDATMRPHQRLGAELVMSAEGLNFFRRNDEIEYQKFYANLNLG